MPLNISESGIKSRFGENACTLSRIARNLAAALKEISALVNARSDDLHAR